MPSATATQTETTTRFSIPLTGAATPRGPNDLLVKPVQRTGALAEYKREQLTPAIGVRFAKDLQLKRIIHMTDKKQQKALLQDLALESEFPPLSIWRVLACSRLPAVERCRQRAAADWHQSHSQSRCTVLLSFRRRT